MGKAELLVSFLLCISAVHAADHVVGGNLGWLDILVDYTEWAAGEKFVAGDKLIFNYDTIHDVLEVDKDGFDICVNSGSIPPYTGGKTTITLTSPGSKYFICTISDHCSGGGMKLAITVEAGSPGGSTPATPPSPSPSPSTTSPPSDITPSPSPLSTPPSDITPSPSPSSIPPPSDIPTPSPSSIPPPSDIPPTPSPSEIPPSDIPTTPPPLQSPPSGGGCAGSFGSLNHLLIGFSLISATLFVFMG